MTEPLIFKTPDVVKVVTAENHYVVTILQQSTELEIRLPRTTVAGSLPPATTAPSDNRTSHLPVYNGGPRKLDEQKVRQIKRRLSSVPRTRRKVDRKNLHLELAKTFSVSEWTIQNIDEGKSWVGVRI